MLVSVLTFDHALDGERARAVGAAPWSGLLLAFVLLGRSPRTIGVLVALGATAQLVVARGSWGLELAYLPLVACGLVLAALPRRLTRR